MDETTKSEVIRKAASAGLLRGSHTEAARLIDHLLANGFAYVGADLQQERHPGKAHAITAAGERVWRR